MQTERWMIYGATGYTGELIAREAVARGLQPVLAGRDEAGVGSLAAELGLDKCIVGLDDESALQQALADMDAVLHCAGPFVNTSRPMVDACLATGTHYLDITGEVVVFESIFRRHEEAIAAGATLLPGVGFDVVPTDSIAAALAEALPDATDLKLAFCMKDGSASRGTLKTMVESLPYSGAVRRAGVLTPVPAAFETREIDFSCGTRWAMTIPWGDLATAYRSTGIPDIRVYTASPPKNIRLIRATRFLLPLLGTRPIKRLLQAIIGRFVTGPTAEVRASARCFLWGEVTNAQGETRTMRMVTPEGYAFTAIAAVEAVRRKLDSPPQPGALTPSMAFGPGFAGELPGVEMESVAVG